MESTVRAVAIFVAADETRATAYAHTDHKRAAWILRSTSRDDACLRLASDVIQALEEGRTPSSLELQSLQKRASSDNLAECDKNSS